MLMTESEAEKLDCPQSLAAGKSQTCLGSLCMAWRWAGWLVKPTQIIHPEPEGHHDRTPEGRLGYCGLASIPYGAPK